MVSPAGHTVCETGLCEPGVEFVKILDLNVEKLYHHSRQRADICELTKMPSKMRPAAG